MPPTLQSIIAHLEREGAEANKRGEPLSAVALYEAAVMLRAVTEPEAIRRALKSGKHFPKIGDMDAEHRAAISEGRSKGNRMMKAARKAGFPTLRELADAVHAQGYHKPIQPPFLSKVGTGLKPCPPDLAVILKRLISWEP